jgi:hypothetical protein
VQYRAVTRKKFYFNNQTSTSTKVTMVDSKHHVLSGKIVPMAPRSFLQVLWHVEISANQIAPFFGHFVIKLLKKNTLHPPFLIIFLKRAHFLWSCGQKIIKFGFVVAEIQFLSSKTRFWHLFVHFTKFWHLVIEYLQTLDWTYYVLYFSWIKLTSSFNLS